MNDIDRLAYAKWEKELCESGNAGFLDHQLVDLRVFKQAEPFTDKAVKDILKQANKDIEKYKLRGSQ